MQIISGQDENTLTKKIAKILNIRLVKTRLQQFGDHSLHVQILAPLLNEDIVIVLSTARPVNDRLMELLLWVDTARKSGARQITVVIPYFGYSRQDTQAISLIASLLETVGIWRIITLDFHAKQGPAFFRIGFDNLDPSPLFAALFPNTADHIVVAPDIGGIMRAQRLSAALQIPYAIINKKRDAQNICHMNDMIGNVKGKHCILVDDIVDTAGTLCKAAELLMERGALSVRACITHAILSGNAIEKIQTSQIQTLYVSDSILYNALPEPFKIISCATLIAEALKPYAHSALPMVSFKKKSMIKAIPTQTGNTNKAC